MTLEEKAHEIASKSIPSYMDDEQPLSDEVFNRIYKTLYEAALKQLSEEEE
jgi:hypothetical protein